MSVFTRHDRLGTGFYGTVYHAQWGEQNYAAKILYPQSKSDRERINNEVSVLKQLRHRHIIQIYHIHEQDEQLYLIMDLVEMGRLSSIIPTATLDWPTKARLAHQIARALEYIHGQGILHTDLNSTKVMLSRHMEAKISDFDVTTRHSSAFSNISNVKGTRRWMAPELLAKNEKYSQKSDMYAFGMVMWEMAANSNRPFNYYDDEAEVVRLVKAGQHETLPNDTPSAYRRWTERCWDQDAAKRPEAREVTLLSVTKPAIVLTIEEPIGSGAYSIVYRARWGGHLCAAKAIHPSHLEGSQAAVQKEVNTFRNLRHRNVIQFYHSLEQGGQFYLIMDLAENGSLATVLATTQLDWLTKERLAHEIARGLQYIHGENILHRDLKSANILLTQHMEIKLCDFGMAKVWSMKASQTNSTKGTVRWMAPELFLPIPQYSTKSDIYAFGMVMWELAANCNFPFKDQDNEAVIVGLIECGEREELPEDTPTEYRQWVEECWDHDPARRPNASQVSFAQTQPTTESEDNEPSFLTLSFSGDHPLEGVSETDSEPLECDHAPDGSKGAISSTTNEASLMLTPDMPLSVTPAVAVGLTANGAPCTVGSLVLEASDHTLPESVDLLILHAQRGDPEAQLAMASRFQEGDGVAKDEAMAMYWYKRAAAQGHFHALSRFASLLYKNRSTYQQRITQVAVWCRLAAEQGDVQAQYNLGMLIYSLFPASDSVGWDKGTAALWFRKAAEQKHTESQFYLGKMYQKGLGVEQDDAKAAFWYLRAGEQGHTDAQAMLGELFTFGRGVERINGEAYLVVREAAERGAAVAQNILGLMYSEGRGVVRNDTAAAFWFLKAARQEHADAQNSLAKMYAAGRGAVKSNKRALKWFRRSAENGSEEALKNLAMHHLSGAGGDATLVVKWCYEAAEKGNADAENILGKFYLQGHAVVKGPTYMMPYQSFLFFLRAATKGHADAQFNLGRMFVDGIGVEKDDIRAIFWLFRAADQGHDKAQLHRGLRHLQGRGVEQSDAEAVVWLKKAAEQGLPEAQNWLGQMYENGRGVEQDSIEAVLWFQKAAEQGMAMAQYNLGVAYKNGRGVECSDVKAALWYQKAAEQGSAVAQFNLGIVYKDGRGVEQSDVEAANWFLESAEQGNAYAQCEVGSMYRNGRGVKKSYSKAVSWYRKSVEQRNSKAQYHLGCMYDFGVGVKQDDSEAVSLYLLSAQQGYAKAQFSMGKLCQRGKLGVGKDIEQAIEWYHKAAAQGHEDAVEALSKIMTKPREAVSRKLSS